MYYLQWDLTRFEGSYKIISKYVSIFLPRFWWISKDWRIDCKTFFKNLVHVFYPQKPLNFLKLFSLEFQASENRQAQDRKNIKFQTGTKMTYLAPSLRFHLVILSGILIALIELAPLEKVWIRPAPDMSSLFYLEKLFRNVFLCISLCIFLALNQFHSYSFNVTCDNFEQYLVIFETNCFSICDTGLPTDTCKELFAQKSIKVMRIINRTICSDA